MDPRARRVVEPPRPKPRPATSTSRPSTSCAVAEVGGGQALLERHAAGREAPSRRSRASAAASASPQNPESTYAALENGRDPTEARAGSRPGHRSRRRSASHPGLSRRTKNNPVLIGEPSVARRSSPRGSPSGSSAATSRRGSWTARRLADPARSSPAPSSAALRGAVEGRPREIKDGRPGDPAHRRAHTVVGQVPPKARWTPDLRSRCSPAASSTRPARRRSMNTAAHREGRGAGAALPAARRPADGRGDDQILRGLRER
jgi:hypothetical protein